MTRDSSKLQRLLLLLAVCLLAACAGPRYQQDFLPNTDFNHLKTYNWRKFVTEINGTDSQHLQALVAQQLTSQGYALDLLNPDILIDLTFIARMSTADSASSFSVSLGIPIGPYGGFGIGSSQHLPNNTFEGVIVTDFTAATTNQLLWRGTADRIPTEFFLRKNEAQLLDVLNSLFRQFPPY